MFGSGQILTFERSQTRLGESFLKNFSILNQKKVQKIESLLKTLVKSKKEIFQTILVIEVW